MEDLKESSDVLLIMFSCNLLVLLLFLGEKILFCIQFYKMVFGSF